MPALKLRLMIAAAAVALGLSGCGGGGGAQVVHKDPTTVATAFTAAFEQGAMGGASQFSDQWHGGMQTFVERTGDSKLDVITKFDNVTATAAHFIFTPADGGKATQVAATVSVDQAVMHKAFEGTPRAQVGALPQAAFDAGMRRQIAKYAERIEAGGPLNLASEGWMTGSGEPPEEFYEGMAPEMRAEVRQHDEEERMQNVTAPMVDPNADAARYMNGGG